MKSNGSFRGFIAAVAGFIGSLKWWGKSTYTDPMLRDPYARQRTRIGTTAKRLGTKQFKAPACVPGTITYRDWLVRKLGYDRRLADGYMFAHLNGYNVKMPMPTDLVSQL